MDRCVDRLSQFLIRFSGAKSLPVVVVDNRDRLWRCLTDQVCHRSYPDVILVILSRVLQTVAALVIHGAAFMYIAMVAERISVLNWGIWRNFHPLSRSCMVSPNPSLVE